MAQTSDLLHQANLFLISCGLLFAALLCRCLTVLESISWVLHHNPGFTFTALLRGLCQALAFSGTPLSHSACHMLKPLRKINIPLPLSFFILPLAWTTAKFDCQLGMDMLPVKANQQKVFSFSCLLGSKNLLRLSAFHQNEVVEVLSLWNFLVLVKRRSPLLNCAGFLNNYGPTQCLP